jgi:murein DD-endopeptidase MepM/ murein hydrolase activator NlpD
MLKMADIFGYDIDFAQDLREGDRFAVVYEEIWRDGEKLRDGDILAASFNNQGRDHTALRFSAATAARILRRGRRSLRKAFLRTPVEFTRISSRFSVARMHPILGTMRAHRGVDYAAPAGTPIRASGDGRIAARGWQSGYGNVIQIDHWQQRQHGVRTHVALRSRHLERHARAAGPGDRYCRHDRARDRPHLHYEFRVNGTHRDPLRFVMPPAPPLSGTELAQFRSHTAPLVSELSLLGQEPATKLAAR